MSGSTTDSIWNRLGGALCFFLVCFLWNDVMTGVAMWRSRDLLMHPKEHPVLPDIGFDIIPQHPLCDTDYLPTYFLVFVMLCTFVRLILLNGFLGYLVIVRFAIVDGVLLFMRGCTVALTSLDNPWPTCNYCGGECPSSVWLCIWTTLKYFPFWDCGDLIFSGHTVHFLLCALSWQFFYQGKYQSVIKTVIWLCTILGITMLSSCRFHYSIDIAIGAILCLLIWYIYETASYVPPNLFTKFVLWVEKGQPFTILDTQSFFTVVSSDIQ